jgi:hypothetical protein
VWPRPPDPCETSPSCHGTRAELASPVQSSVASAGEGNGQKDNGEVLDDELSFPLKSLIISEGEGEKDCLCF